MSDQLRLINQHNEVLARAEIDADKMPMPDEKAILATAPEALTRAEKVFEKIIGGLSADASDEEISKAIDKAISDGHVVPIFLTALTEWMAKETHELLRPLSQNIASEVMAAPEVGVFIQGMVAGMKPMLLAQARKQIRGED